MERNVRNELLSEIELYARGLALADGYVHHGGSCQYGMARSAEAILTQIGVAFGSKAGVRVNKRGSIKLTVPGKAWWKHSVKDLDVIHAFRGYVEGDGCWTKFSRKQFREGRWKVYTYPRVLILWNIKELWLESWILKCLEGYNYCVMWDGKRHKVRKFVLDGKSCMRLWHSLYDNAQVYYKRKLW